MAGVRDFVMGKMPIKWIKENPGGQNHNLLTGSFKPVFAAEEDWNHWLHTDDRYESGSATDKDVSSLILCINLSPESEKGGVEGHVQDQYVFLENLLNFMMHTNKSLEDMERTQQDIAAVSRSLSGLSFDHS